MREQSISFFQQFKKNTDRFIENQFTAKGYTVIYKKTSFTPGDKKIELAFLSKRFTQPEMQSLDSVLAKNKYLRGTQLVIKQDSTDRLDALKGDILKQVQSKENELNEKDVKIMQLEQKLASGYDDKKLLKEANALFPHITAVSVSKQDMVNQKDSIIPITSVLYRTDKPLTDDDKARLNKWLNQRLDVKNAKVFDVND